MAKIKLTYFDFHGGRGEPARLAMYIGGVDWDDERWSFQEFGEKRHTTPYNAVPVLEVDGKRLAQSNAINRYIGKMTDLYPSDPWQAAVCDEVMEAIEDFSQALTPTLREKDEDRRKAMREKLASGPLTTVAKGLRARLAESGGEYFADGRLTVADLKVFVWTRHVRSGNIDHVPRDLVDQLAPELVAHFERVNSHPKIVEYYASR